MAQKQLYISLSPPWVLSLMLRISDWATWNQNNKVILRTISWFVNVSEPPWTTDIRSEVVPPGGFMKFTPPKEVKVPDYLHGLVIFLGTASRLQVSFKICCKKTPFLFNSASLRSTPHSHEVWPSTWPSQLPRVQRPLLKRELLQGFVLAIWPWSPKQRRNQGPQWPRHGVPPANGPPLHPCEKRWHRLVHKKSAQEWRSWLWPLRLTSSQPLGKRDLEKPRLSHTIPWHPGCVARFPVQCDLFWFRTLSRYLSPSLWINRPGYAHSSTKIFHYPHPT